VPFKISNFDLTIARARVVAMVACGAWVKGKIVFPSTWHIYGVTHYNSIKTTHFQLLFNSIIITLVMSFDVINCLPFIKIWHVALWKNLDIMCFLNIDFHCPLWLSMAIQDYDTWHNLKMPYGILIVFWKIYKIKIFIFIAR
jgi:hypothetical protein